MIFILFYSGWFFSNFPEKSSFSGQIASVLILIAGPVLAGMYFMNRRLSDSESMEANKKIKLMVKRFLSALILILFGFHVKISLLERFTVNGISMEPGLRDQESIWVEKISSGLPLPDLTFPGGIFTQKKLLYGSYSRGEIVLIQYPGMTDSSSDYFMKRIIGLPGDRYQFTEEGIRINGEILEEHYLMNSDSSFYTENSYAPMREFPQELMSMAPEVLYSAANGIQKTGEVPADSLLVLGDNRKFSRDSRNMGFVPVIFIKGKLLKSNP